VAGSADDASRGATGDPARTGRVGVPEQATIGWSGRLVAWGNAYLAGLYPMSEVRAAVEAGADSVAMRHPPGDWRTWLETLTASDLGAHGWLRLALPVAGDLAELRGDRALTDAALAAGEAVLAANQALVPEVATYGPPGDVGVAVVWSRHERLEGPAPTTSVGQADRRLATAVIEAADRLQALDVADFLPLPESPHPSGGTGAGRGSGAGYRASPRRAASPRPSGDHDLLLPGVYPHRAQVLATRSARMRQIVATAAAGDGGALTVATSTARSGVLRDLEAAAREGIVAACQALAEGN
jgi:hypothetical protein